MLGRKKWAWRESGKRKNPRRGRRKREASEKAHPGSLLLGCGEKSGRGEKVASGKTYGVGAGREKQAGKPVGRETGMLIMLLVYL